MVRVVLTYGPTCPRLRADLSRSELSAGRVVWYPTPRLCNRQTSGESASLPQYLGCNTVFDMRLRVTFLRRKTVSLQSNIAHREGTESADIATNENILLLDEYSKVKLF